MGQINHDTAAFAEACQERVLRIARCSDCGTWIHPPKRMCPACWSDDIAAEEVGGSGRLVSYSLPRPPIHAAEPVVTGVVELEGADDVRLLAPIVGAHHEQLVTGLLLELRWLERDGVTILAFAPAAVPT